MGSLYSSEKRYLQMMMHRQSTSVLFTFLPGKIVFEDIFCVSFAGRFSADGQLLSCFN